MAVKLSDWAGGPCKTAGLRGGRASSRCSPTGVRRAPAGAAGIGPQERRPGRTGEEAEVHGAGRGLSAQARGDGRAGMGHAAVARSVHPGLCRRRRLASHAGARRRAQRRGLAPAMMAPRWPDRSLKGYGSGLEGPVRAPKNGLDSGTDRREGFPCRKEEGGKPRLHWRRDPGGNGKGPMVLPACRGPRSPARSREAACGRRGETVPAAGRRREGC